MKPFDVEDVLRYTYKGEITGEEQTQENDAAMVID